MIVKKYVLSEYHTYTPNAEKYYFDTRDEAERFESHLRYIDYDIDKITISDDLEDVDVSTTPNLYFELVVYYKSKPTKRGGTYYRKTREEIEAVEKGIWDGKEILWGDDKGHNTPEYIDHITISSAPVDSCVRSWWDITEPLDPGYDMFIKRLRGLI